MWHADVRVDVDVGNLGGNREGSWMALVTMRYLTLAGVVALLTLMLWVGHPGNAEWWTMALPFGVWIVGPTIMPYVLARRFRDARGFVRLMLALLILSGAGAGLGYYEAFFASESSTAGLAMVFIPLCQWVALITVSLVGIAAIIWRRRHH
jgi:hypothetical protein